MPDEKHIASGASSDSRGEEIDKATALPAESSTSAGKDDNGKGQSDTGRADQTDTLCTPPASISADVSHAICSSSSAEQALTFRTSAPCLTPAQTRSAQIAFRVSASCSPMPPLKMSRSMPPRLAIIAAICLATDRQKMSMASWASGTASDNCRSFCRSPLCPEMPRSPDS
jgi:hypothetical protein